MPPLLPSLALLLLVLLTLLAISNRELIALTFLGMGTLALPLSVWILGGIALGFLLGIWILLLFRFGTATAAGYAPNGDRPRKTGLKYGAEDFAVVDNGYGGLNQQRNGEPAYGTADYSSPGYSSPSYTTPEPAVDYSENRFDDIYDRGRSNQGYRDRRDYGDRRDYSDEPSPANSSEASDQFNDRSPEPYSQQYDSSESGVSDYSASDYDISDYSPSDYAGSGYNRDNSPETEPQDRFSAANGGYGTPAPPASNNSPREDVSQPPPVSESAADWDDEYREDWTDEELSPEPVLRERNATPRLKRWFSKPSNSSPSQTDPPRPEEAQQSPSSSPEPYPSDSDRNTVYDADYRVIQPAQPRAPEAVAQSEAGSQSEAIPQQQANSRRSDRSSSTQRKENSNPQSEWDIESDLDW